MKNSYCKTGLSTILVTILWASVFCMPAYGENVIDTKLGQYLEEYKKSHSFVISELINAKKNSDEIINLLNKINRLNKLATKNIKNQKLYDKYSNESSQLSDTMMDKFGIAMTAAAMSGNTFNESDISKKQLDILLANTLKIYEDTSKCFEYGIFSKNSSCSSFCNNCEHYGTNNGKMYFLELTNSLEKKEVDVTEDDPRISKEEKYYPLIHDYYQFCRLRSMISPLSTPKTFGKHPDSFKFIEDFWGKVYPYNSEFKKMCIDKAPSKERIDSLFALYAEFPNDWVIKTAYNDYSKWQTECKSAVSMICNNTYVIQNQVILAYETVGCEIREVTKEDIENDLKWLDTNAQKLNHSILLEDISYCQEAHNNGYYWFYRKPVLSQKCLKSIKESKKIKSKKKK